MKVPSPVSPLPLGSQDVCWLGYPGGTVGMEWGVVPDSYVLRSGQ